MPILSLDPIREAAGELPTGWLERAALPPNTPAGLRYGRDWWDTPKEDRRQLVFQARGVPELFVLWTWELDAPLRAEIVRALGAVDDADVESSNAVLKTIFLEETPDEGGEAVRRNVKQILGERAQKEVQVARVRGAVPTRGAIRTRGAVRTRSASPSATRDRSARAILSELEDLQAANPRFKS